MACSSSLRLVTVTAKLRQLIQPPRFHADDSAGVVNLIKHKVLMLILPCDAIARSQPGGRSIRSILSNHLTVEENKP
jgi:hypothetical protein